MKKGNILPIVMGLLLSAVLVMGCGSAKTQDDNASASGSSPGQGEQNAEASGESHSVGSHSDDAASGEVSAQPTSDRTTESAKPDLEIQGTDCSQYNTDGQEMVEARYDSIIVKNAEEYPELSESLNSLNDQIEQEVLSGVDDLLPDAENQYAAGQTTWTPMAQEESLTIPSANDTYVCILLEYYFNANGAHPSTSTVSFNYNSQTGQQLELSDVIADMDDFPALVADRLQENYSGAPFYSDDVAGLVSGLINHPDETGGLAWYLMDDGMHILFPAESIAPYAAGEFEVTFPYAENGDLFLDPYGPSDGS